MDIARLIIYMGISLIVIGGIFWIFSHLGINFGHLPGDIAVKGEKSSFYFPIVTSIVVSIVLTILINAILIFLRK